MIDKMFARTMARYNRWQNRSLYGAAEGLSDEARKQDRGAFFGSIHATFNHLLWADQMWLSRFWPEKVQKPAVSIPGSTGLHSDWSGLLAARGGFDDLIVDWADGLDQTWLGGDLTWFSGAIGKEVTRPSAFCVTHFFNHQTHHRGQAHAMLTAAGARPEDTDLFIMPAGEWQDSG